MGKKELVIILILFQFFLQSCKDPWSIGIEELKGEIRNIKQEQDNLKRELQSDNNANQRFHLRSVRFTQQNHSNSFDYLFLLDSKTGRIWKYSETIKDNMIVDSEFFEETVVTLSSSESIEKAILINKEIAKYNEIINRFPFSYIQDPDVPPGQYLYERNEYNKLIKELDKPTLSDEEIRALDPKRKIPEDEIKVLRGASNNRIPKNEIERIYKAMKEKAENATKSNLPQSKTNQSSTNIQTKTDNINNLVLDNNGVSNDESSSTSTQ